jgi:hypothetical protein
MNSVTGNSQYIAEKHLAKAPKREHDYKQTRMDDLAIIFGLPTFLSCRVQEIGL